MLGYADGAVRAHDGVSRLAGLSVAHGNVGRGTRRSRTRRFGIGRNVIVPIFAGPARVARGGRAAGAAFENVIIQRFRLRWRYLNWHKWLFHKNLLVRYEPDSNIRGDAAAFLPDLGNIWY